MTRDWLKHIPNLLTFIRLISILPFVCFLFKNQYDIAFYIFFISGLTDGFDGWLARHFHWQSWLGSIIDPMADKLLVSASFFSLALLNQLPWFVVILVIFRDITISVGVAAWIWVVRRPIEFKPTLLSKGNTVLQLCLVTLALFQLAFFELPSYYFNSLIFLTTITTLLSYIDYVWTWGKKASQTEQLS